MYHFGSSWFSCFCALFVLPSLPHLILWGKLFYAGFIFLRSQGFTHYLGHPGFSPLFHCMLPRQPVWPIDFHLMKITSAAELFQTSATADTNIWLFCLVVWEPTPIFPTPIPPLSPSDGGNWDHQMLDSNMDNISMDTLLGHNQGSRKRRGRFTSAFSEFQIWRFELRSAYSCFIYIYVYYLFIEYI